jgi:hypothetical protein
MSFAQSLFICFATLMTFNLWKLALARARHKTKPCAPSSAAAAAATIGIMALCLGANSVAQETPSADGSEPAVSKMSSNVSVVTNPNMIMGFEQSAAWLVSSGTADPNLSVQLTGIRTQGNAAYAVSNPPALFKLISRPISSSATALAGIGNSGALLQLDVLVPCGSSLSTHGESGTCGPAADGLIEGFVSSNSRGLNHISLGNISLNKYRTGIYNTIPFEIPASVASALGDANYSDLIFEFEVRAPEGNVGGTYLFDNLRVHSVELIQSPNGEAPPVDYGESVEFTVNSNKLEKHTFDVNPVQIPSGLHLKLGAAGTTTIVLEGGLDSSTSFTCNYVPDSSDKSGQLYKFNSCSAGYEAGDIITANWLSLGISGGQSSQQLYTQFAVRPLGDLIGAGLLPPMPTFWGNSDTCSPAPVAGKAVTSSTSCSNQTAQANQIVTNYFNQVNSAHPSSGWVVAPVPDGAIRHADGTPTNQLGAKAAVSPDDSSNELTFDTGGDLNPGGSFDAYWKLSGDLDPTAVAGTNENLTHFDTAFTAHGVLFGQDVDVVDAKLTADTDSGETTPASKPATSSGTLDFFVFGEEFPSGGESFNPSTGFSIDPSLDEELDLPPIQVWIFTLTLGADVEADLSVQGSAALSGADLSATPNVSLNANIKGGVNLGIAQGDVDAKVNLVKLSTPVSAQAKWDLDTDPSICAAEVSGSLDGNVDISSGGGSVNLDATFGDCPFCITDSWTLFKWGALASKSFNLFNDTISTQLFGLPGSMCSYPITVSIQSPSSGAVLSSTLPITLTGSAAPTESTVPFTATYNWTFTPGANASTVTVNPTGANRPNPTVTFGPPTSGNTSTWTINLTATTTVHSAGGAVLTQTATATPVTIQVTNLAPGAYISQVSSANNGIATPQNGVLNVGNVPGTITFSGIVDDAPSTPTTTFTVAPCTYITNGKISTCLVNLFSSPTTLTTVGANTATPSASWMGFEGGYYLVTMTTAVGVSTFGTTSAVIYGTVLF